MIQTYFFPVFFYVVSIHSTPRRSHRNQKPRTHHIRDTRYRVRGSSPGFSRTYPSNVQRGALILLQSGQRRQLYVRCASVHKVDHPDSTSDLFTKKKKNDWQFALFGVGLGRGWISYFPDSGRRNAASSDDPFFVGLWNLFVVFQVLTMLALLHFRGK